MATKKHGKKAAACKIYREQGIREKNKRRRLVRHLKKFPNDMTAQTALDLL